MIYNRAKLQQSFITPVSYYKLLAFFKKQKETDETPVTVFRMRPVPFGQVFWLLFQKTSKKFCH